MNLARGAGGATAMDGLRAPLVEVDAASFDPWRIQPVRHALVDHPLLQLRALIALGERLEARGSIRTHGNEAVKTLSAIKDAKAWMSLLNVQIDPVYRVLVGAACRGVAVTLATMRSK